MNAVISASFRSLSATSSAIWLRSAIEALFWDSNTLSPSQIGQATRLEISSMRSPWLWGPESRVAPTARKPATTKTSNTQPGQRLTRRFSSLGISRTAPGTAAGSS
jgi:hypothetical protein